MKMHFKSQSYWYKGVFIEHHAGGSLAVNVILRSYSVLPWLC